MTSKSLSIFADGGARGNPGPAAIGFLVKDHQGQVLIKRKKSIGQRTNNVAEYMAVIEALKWLANKSTSPSQRLIHPWRKRVTFFLDSKLVVNQLNGLFRVKNFNLRNLVVKVRQLEKEIGGNVSYRFIPREKNKEADALVNQSLDQNFF